MGGISITTTTGTQTVNYYPVLGGTNPQPDKFAYSTDGTNFTEIAKPEGGYTMSGDVATYAKSGQLYYKGSVNTVRSVNDISWNDTFSDSAGGTYPYHASTGYDMLQARIKAKIASDQTEKVERVAMETSGTPSNSNPPKINGVELKSIWNAYKGGTQSFGGKYDGYFWSCVTSNSVHAFNWTCGNGCWEAYDCNDNDGNCVLVSRAFS